MHNIATVEAPQTYPFSAPLSLEGTAKMRAPEQPLNEQILVMKAQIAREMTAIAEKLNEAAGQVAAGDCQRAAQLTSAASKQTTELARVSRLLAFLS